MDTWELFSKGIAPAMAHPKVRERRRGPVGGMLAQWGADGPMSPVWTCKGLWGCPGANESGPAAWQRGELKPWAHEWPCCYGADVRFSPGCLKWKFIKARTLFLKAKGVRLEWHNSRAAQRSGVQRVFQNSATAYPLRFESLLPISPERAPGKWHFPKHAARSEMLADWCCDVSGETVFLEAVMPENSPLGPWSELLSLLGLGH